eukprot:7803637-Karenia_brevis.AAC.1
MAWPLLAFHKAWCLVPGYNIEHPGPKWVLSKAGPNQLLWSSIADCPSPTPLAIKYPFVPLELVPLWS